MTDLQEKSIELWRDAHFELHWKLRVAEARIEKLEAKLREIINKDSFSMDWAIRTASEALEGKDD